MFLGGLCDNDVDGGLGGGDKRVERDTESCECIFFLLWEGVPELFYGRWILGGAGMLMVLLRCR